MIEQVTTFSFGKNWQDYLTTVSDREIALAEDDIKRWLGASAVKDRTVVDIGSGSGIHSLAFLRLGARRVHSFDLDRYSVEATKSLRHSAGSPENWSVAHGSILDPDYVRSVGQFDVVYSWGVLHHTGAMWQAVENAFSLVVPGGTVWISLYKKGPRYERDLQTKRKYNAATPLGKRLMEYRRAAKFILSRARHLQNPLAWNRKQIRGMNEYHDIKDWLGGLPYETATADEVVTFARRHNLVLERIKVGQERGCNIYVLSAPN